MLLSWLSKREKDFTWNLSLASVSDVLWKIDMNHMLVDLENVGITFCRELTTTQTCKAGVYLCDWLLSVVFIVCLFCFSVERRSPAEAGPPEKSKPLWTRPDATSDSTTGRLQMSPPSLRTCPVFSFFLWIIMSALLRESLGSREMEKGIPCFA